MKTEDFVAMLATGAVAVEENAAARRYATALGWGAFGATLLMAVLLGVRSDLAAASLMPMFWVKLAFSGTLAGASTLSAMHLSRPGARLVRSLIAIAAPVLAMWLLAAFAFAQTERELWPEIFLGTTWRSCPLLVATLSVPVFAAVLWAMRGLAPTRLRLAGAAAGLLAGAVGALVYSLHCPELAAPFVGFWYLLGMLIPAIVGGLLGPWMLRW